LFVCLLCPLINISLLFGGGGTIVARSRPGRRGLLLHGIVDGRLFQTLVLLLILGRIHANLTAPHLAYFVDRKHHISPTFTFYLDVLLPT
jgi:hypothetical protein